MGPKKGKPGKKKGKKGKGGLGDDVDDAERNFILQAEIESLSLRLAAQQRKADMAKASELEKMYRHREDVQNAEKERKITNDIISDMTRQYKATQEELMEKEGQLTMKIDQNDEEIKHLTAQKEEIAQDKKKKEEEKEEQITSLKRHIESMSNNFQQMLKETLDKMKNRIESANKQWQEENEAKMLQKFEEIVNPGNAVQ